jgi:hypothetical protein
VPDQDDSTSGFYWDPRTRKYFYNGEAIPRSEITGVVDSLSEATAKRIAAVTAQLQDGSVEIGDWQAAIETILEEEIALAVALGSGGLGQMAEGQWQTVDSLVATQSGYLANFVSDIKSGDVRLDSAELANRAASYARSVTRAYQQAYRHRSRELGLYERNVLGGSKEPCDECPGLSALGWQPAETLPAPGDRECGIGCNCTVELASAEDVLNDQGYLPGRMGE